MVEHVRGAADRAGALASVALIVAERPIQQLRQAAGLVGVRSAKRRVGRDRLAQLSGRVHRLLLVRAPQPAHTAEIIQLRRLLAGGVARRQCRGPVQVGLAAPQRRFRLSRARVVARRELFLDGCQLVLDGLGLVVQLLAGALEPLLRGGQTFQPENPGQRVVHVAGPAVEHAAELGVRQERAVGRQISFPAEAGQITARLAGTLHRALRVADVGAMPPAYDRCRARLAILRKPYGNLARVGGMEVAPAVPPDLGTSLPAVAVPGQRHLRRLGEAGLSRSVAPHDQRQPGARLELQRRLRPHAAKAPHRDRPEVRCLAIHGLGRGHLRTLPWPCCALQRLRQLVVAFERRQDQ